MERVPLWLAVEGAGVGRRIQDRLLIHAGILRGQRRGTAELSVRCSEPGRQDAESPVSSMAEAQRRTSSVI